MMLIISKRYACENCGIQRDLQVHHCLHGADRKKADRDGLTVYLCPLCHKRLHSVDYKLDLKFKQLAQREYEKEHGHEAYMSRYHKNYLGKEV